MKHDNEELRKRNKKEKKSEIHEMYTKKTATRGRTETPQKIKKEKTIEHMQIKHELTNTNKREKETEDNTKAKKNIKKETQSHKRETNTKITLDKDHVHTERAAGREKKKKHWKKKIKHHKKEKQTRLPFQKTNKKR